MRVPLTALLTLGILIAGCTAPGSPGMSGGGVATKPFLGTDGLYHYERTFQDGTALHFAWAPGALSHVNVTGGQARVSVEPFVEKAALRLTTMVPVDGSLKLYDGKAVDLSPGQTFWFIPAPAQKVLSVDVGQGASTCCYGALDPAADGLPLTGTHPFVSGANMIALEEYQQTHFPHRQPGLPNYAASQQYFSKYFTDLGYQVEVDPYGTDSTPAAAFANIVATKPGTGPHANQVIFVAGGHYDMVAGTVNAAFDNTSGSVGTMELARALAPYKFDHTLKFALWGGEESGTLGSAFWIKTHPDAIAHVVSYWNLDVIGMSWPAHPQTPSPILIAAGPDIPSQANDGSTSDPVSTNLLGFAKTLQHAWMGYPDDENGTQVFRYEGVDSGERSGYAKVNSQSDHDSFTKAGIPGYFIFNGDTLKEQNPVGIHTKRDTLANMTKVALSGKDALLDSDLSPADEAKGRDLLARSFEATLFFPLYYTLLTDLGQYTPPGVASKANLPLPPIQG